MPLRVFLLTSLRGRSLHEAQEQLANLDDPKGSLGEQLTDILLLLHTHTGESVELIEREAARVGRVEATVKRERRRANELDQMWIDFGGGD